MKVTLMVDWERKEILTVREFDQKIDDKVDEIMQDTELYDEYLDDYLDTNYTKIELFKTLTGNKDDFEEIIGNVRSGVSEAIYDWVNYDISSNYEDVVVDI